MGLLYTFTLGGASSLYELYLVVLRLAIAFAVALSVLVSLDRLLHVLKCFQVLNLPYKLETDSSCLLACCRFLALKASLHCFISCSH